MFMQLELYYNSDDIMICELSNRLRSINEMGLAWDPWNPLNNLRTRNNLRPSINKSINGALWMKDSG